MADKKYIVIGTVHAVEKKGGKKVVLLRSTEPQPVPASLVKELLEEGLIAESGDSEEAPAPPKKGKTSAKPKTAPVVPTTTPPAPDDDDSDEDGAEDDDDTDDSDNAGGGDGGHGSGD